MDENWPNYTDIPFKLQVIASIAYHWIVSYDQMQFNSYEKHPIKSIYRIFSLSLSISPLGLSVNPLCMQA